MNNQGISIETVVTQLSEEIKTLAGVVREDNANIHKELKDIKVNLAKLSDYEKLKDKVSALESFRYKFAGAVIIVQFIITMAITYFAGGK